MNLTNQAVEIRRHHNAARAAAVTAIEHALAAGEILAKVKEELPHGEFGAWVTTECGFSDRTARRYMQLHTHRAALPEGAGVKAALQHMTAPKPSVKTDTVSDFPDFDLDTYDFDAPPGERPDWLAPLGEASICGDIGSHVWIVWESQSGFAHIIWMLMEDDKPFEFCQTKSPIRCDLIPFQIFMMGIPRPAEQAWRKFRRTTADGIREILRKPD